MYPFTRMSWRLRRGVSSSARMLECYSLNKPRRGYTDLTRRRYILYLYKTRYGHQHIPKQNFSYSQFQFHRTSLLLCINENVSLLQFYHLCFCLFFSALYTIYLGVLRLVYVQLSRFVKCSTSWLTTFHNDCG